MACKITDFDESLPVDFVFGSNELGQHGGGAAGVAWREYGARYAGHGGAGQGFGPQGNCFGIPTCSKTCNQPDHDIEYDKLKYYIQCFLLWARLQMGRRQFKVTQIGCGLAGWKSEEVAPLFNDAPPNCFYDTAWHEFLGDEKKYWGHVG